MTNADSTDYVQRIIDAVCLYCVDSYPKETLEETKETIAAILAEVKRDALEESAKICDGDKNEAYTAAIWRALKRKSKEIRELAKSVKGEM